MGQDLGVWDSSEEEEPEEPEEPEADTATEAGEEDVSPDAADFEVEEPEVESWADLR
jgi:hypothetical protein